MARENGVVDWSVNATAGTVTGTFKGKPPIVLDLADVSDANKAYAALHGFKQRLADGMALSRNKETGESATVEEKYAEVARLRDHYASGSPDWGLRVASGAGAEGGLTIRAIARVQGLDVPAMRERLERMAEKKDLTMRALLARFAKYEAVIAAMADIRREEAGPADVAEDMLAELAGDEE